MNEARISAKIGPLFVLSMGSFVLFRLFQLIMLNLYMISNHAGLVQSKEHILNININSIIDKINLFYQFVPILSVCIVVTILSLIAIIRYFDHILIKYIIVVVLFYICIIIIINPLSENHIIHMMTSI